MTFSYSFVWYSWEDWERLLDWAAWRGINLQLAWVGYEKIFLDTFRDLGMSDEEILPFFSGPAFQAWNRFGNIQGSWGGVGNLSVAWIESQFELQKKIVSRMVELGITPILPAFAGFVPEAFIRVRPNANITQASSWSGVPDQYTQDTFLSPLDESYAELQHEFLSRQINAFGNVTNIYTLDQFNEMQPASGDVEYLSTISEYTYKALTDANPAAVWLLQGWLFYSNSFWTQDRISAYLGGAEGKESMLILDLYSESAPQWQRTESYFGRPWIWCQLHDFGGNMALEGQITNITVNSVEALTTSPSLVGFGLTPEGYEGNEIVYDLLLDQAWSDKPLDTQSYFQQWAATRYAGSRAIPSSLYEAWELLRQNVYNNTNDAVPCVGTSIYQLEPSLTGLVNRTGHWPAPTALFYDPSALQQIWSLMLSATKEEPTLWQVPAFQLDFVDVTRQVMSNAFIDIYLDLLHVYSQSISAYGTSDSNPSRQILARKALVLLDFLDSLDEVLSTTRHFTLSDWLASAEQWVGASGMEQEIAFNARSQVTVWNWDAEDLNDYASKAWSGLIRSYYMPRWSIFVDGLKEAAMVGTLNETALYEEIRAFEKTWQNGGFVSSTSSGKEAAGLQETISAMQKQWPDIFGNTHAGAI